MEIRISNFDPILSCTHWVFSIKVERAIEKKSLISMQRHWIWPCCMRVCLMLSSPHKKIRTKMNILKFLQIGFLIRVRDGIRPRCRVPLARKGFFLLIYWLPYGKALFQMEWCISILKACAIDRKSYLYWLSNPILRALSSSLWPFPGWWYDMFNHALKLVIH